ncbi:proline-rich protein 29-like [Hyla sarda]|uniref:proline-rich protein 29-like n=1 Tax=Hyla sarda TaxID=327740 RepID=UPI0024C24E86|nr:proline-rich protein 29-like [Hyla sarda]
MFQQVPADTPFYTSSGIQIIPSPVPHQPTIIQQLPTDFTPPLSHPIRYGRAKEDLIELMMIQNAQMHQVIMNNMTMSALSSFGYGSTPPPPVPNIMPVQIEDDEPMVYHHHYESYPASYPTYPTYPTLPPMAPVPHREPTVRHIGQDTLPATPSHHVDLRAVPPPPPLSATGTVGADIPPASEYYDLTEARI